MPDQDDIEAAAAGVAHQLVEPGPAGFRSADPVGELGDDLQAAMGGHLAQVIELGFGC